MFMCGSAHLRVRENNQKNKEQNTTEILLRQRYCLKWTSHIVRVVVWGQSKKIQPINEFRDRCEGRILCRPAWKQKNKKKLNKLEYSPKLEDCTAPVNVPIFAWRKCFFCQSTLRIYRVYTPYENVDLSLENKQKKLVKKFELQKYHLKSKFWPTYWLVALHGMKQTDFEFWGPNQNFFCRRHLDLLCQYAWSLCAPAGKYAINRGLNQNFCTKRSTKRGLFSHDSEKMTGKTIKSIQELGEFFKYGNAGSNNELWDPFNRLFRVSMKSSRMEIPKKFEAKLSRWFHLPGDEHEEQSIKRAELQTVGWYSQILEL